MGIEIERKFLVQGDSWRSKATATPYRQGYILATKERVVRVRIAGEQAYITIKGESVGIGRAEYEYPIPVTDATELLDTLCDRPQIEKVRHCLASGDLVWEIDEFHGENQGLIMAEVELPNADYPLQLPDWIREEVTQDPRYYNAYLSKHPYQTWGISS
ncbi:CYTH domain-containing protein [Leptolyngbya sp. FACHB-711]|uniref:CYTH domain-containing protein n=1 Tax=unclassified Leptolyngbya TaxID=2650499 RepID=UPI00168829EB|nr:CYTH domain-containing protein [Leptolyngbya sp. FACHB-711]MBD1850605.1 CYTH domain-containing protein [Cyanobacteria bacterium FACHB-502]MBD2026023.1 CYTH domain-containing protein [Leptolyngbya sp. FACHB-711]